MLKLKYLSLFALIIFASSYFAVWQKDISVPLVSSIMTLILFSPSLMGVIRWLGNKRSILLFIFLSIFAYTIEIIGIITHFPYGEFSYNNNVGLLLMDFIPITLPFAWIPLLIGSVALSYKYKDNLKKYYLSFIFWIVSIDIVLDPGAVYLKFWEYAEKGIWYNVPMTNYFGWLLSGTLGFIIANIVINKTKQTPPIFTSYSYFLSLAFWTGVCFYAQIWGGFIIGFILLGYLFYKFRITIK